MDFSKYITTVIMLLIVYNVYNIAKSYIADDESHQTYKNVNRYLVNEAVLCNNKLPILWIYMEYDKNSRWWENFYSRTSNDLNQPYLYLTIKSIIDRCGSHFNVCLIDDESLSDIIPDWNVNIEKTANPIKGNLRDLAQAYILKYYGGLFVPPSFLCTKNLSTMYHDSVFDEKVLVGELRSASITSTNSDVFVSKKFIGAYKNCKIIDDYIEYLKQLISIDCTNESVFKGSAETWLHEQAKKENVITIPAKFLGVKDITNKIVTIDKLVGSSFVDFCPEALGIYFPQEQILNRTAYQWFANLNANQLLESDTIMGKLIVSNYVG